MHLSAPFIQRPVATSLLSLALLMAGSVAYSLLPVASLPDVDIPVIGVGAGMPGASPETMASAVATPLERQFGRIAGVEPDDLDEFAGLGERHFAVRHQSQHRRRRPRRAGLDQRGAQPVAVVSAAKSQLPQGQSGRSADPDSDADLGRGAQAADVRHGRLHSGAEDLADSGRRPGLCRRQLQPGSARRN